MESCARLKVENERVGREIRGDSRGCEGGREVRDEI